MLFKRDPALILLFVATSVRMISAFWLDWSIDQQALVNVLAAAIVGALVAFTVRHDGQVAALTGAFGALIAAAVGFGLRLSAEQQAIIMSLIGAGLAFFTRTQVGASVGPLTKPAVLPPE